MKSIRNRRVSLTREVFVRSASAETENQRNQARSGAGLGACACACVRAVVAVLALTPFPRVGETLAFFRQFSFAVAVSLGGVSLEGGRSGGARSRGRPLPRASERPRERTRAPEGARSRGRPLPRAPAPDGARSRGRSRERAPSGAVLCVPGWPHQFGVANGAIMAFFN